jgi:hypothetical protein
VPWSHELNQTCEYTGWSSQEFYDRFIRRFRMRPIYHAASSFASALILLTAVEATQSLDPTILLNEIKQNSYATFYGNCSFATLLHQCNIEPVVLQKVSLLFCPCFVLFLICFCYIIICIRFDIYYDLEGDNCASRQHDFNQ